MTPTSPRVVLAVALAAVGALLAGALIRASGPVDRPRERGAHARPTPTSGGLAVLFGVSLGLLVLGPGALAAPALLGAFGVALALGLLGAADDLLDLPARGKLLAQGLAGLAFALVCARIERLPLPGGAALVFGAIAGALGTALWLVVVVNAVNFMDGVNGLAPGAAVLMFLALAGAGARTGEEGVAALALLGAAAGLGFLPWNFPKARLFQGDAGALFSSFLLAALLVAAPVGGGSPAIPVLFGPILLTPFLTDVLLTLLRRARRGAPLTEAHAEHLYQRWFARRGRSHVQVTLRVYLACAAYAALALFTVGRSEAIAWSVFLVGLAAGVLAWSRLSRALDARSGPAASLASAARERPSS